MENNVGVHVEIYTESTPNPESLKFVLVNRMILPNQIAEFKSKESAKVSELASELFESPFIQSVFISNNFLTLTKKESYEWYEITPELKEIVKQFFKSGRTPVSQGYVDETNASGMESGDEIENKIVQLLDKYVKPAIEMDGGHIAFKSFSEGKVTVSLQGACSGCPSSMVTLKSGIEGLLKRMVPEVEEVIAEEN